MFKKKIFGSWLVAGLSLAVTALNALAQAPSASGAPKPAGGVEENGTASHPNEVDRLLDQIDLKIQFPGGAKFVVSTRPGEFIYVSEPALGGLEKRLSFIIVPTPFGEEPVSRDELLRRPPKSIGFRFVPFCLNAADIPKPTDKSSTNSCIPRPTGDVGGDFVFPLSGLKKIDIAADETFSDSVTGAEITVLDFRSSGFSRLQEFNAFAKCCKVSQGIKLCGCAVLTETSSCNSFCPVSDSMQAEFAAKQ